MNVVDEMLIADIKKLQFTDQIEVAKELLSNDGWLFYLLWIEGKINEGEKRYDRTKKG